MSDEATNTPVEKSTVEKSTETSTTTEVAAATKTEEEVSTPTTTTTDDVPSSTINNAEIAAAAAAAAAASATTTENDTNENADDDNAPNVEEENTTANFAPVVQLEEIEVRSGEEDENLLFSARAKLFIYGETMLDKGTGIKSWIERGIGDIRMLQHRTSGHIRVLMRQEKTLKIICNHQIDPRIVLTPNIGNDRSWIWCAYDFADGVELVETVFACRFKDSDLANTFKTEFEKCQLENKKFYDGADAEDTSAGDAIAQAFVSISTNE